MSEFCLQKDCKTRIYTETKNSTAEKLLIVLSIFQELKQFSSIEEFVLLQTQQAFWYLGHTYWCCIISKEKKRIVDKSMPQNAQNIYFSNVFNT